MKKIYLILIIGILLVGTIIAGDIIIKLDKEIKLDKIFKDKLIEINLDDINYEDYELNGLYQRCLKKDNCYEIPYTECKKVNCISDSFISETEFIPSEICEIKCNDYIRTECKNLLDTCSGFMSEDKLDKWQEDKMIMIANVSINRNTDKIKVKDGKIKLKDK